VLGPTIGSVQTDRGGLGLPTGKGERPWWLKLVGWIVGGYLVLFLLTTMQDQMSGGAETIAYTEFTTRTD